MDPALTMYYRKLSYKIAMLFLVVGALNWGFIAFFKLNPIQSAFGKVPIVPRILYGAVGVCALIVMFSRDFYLPFLGETLVPCAAIKEKIPEGAQVSVKVGLTPGQKVLYWAAEPNTERLKTLQGWKDAYLGYENAGVTTADDQGVAVLRLRRPQPYAVPMRGKLEPHVHYRVCQQNGFLGPVQTVFLNEDNSAAAGPASAISENFLYRWG